MIILDKDEIDTVLGERVNAVGFHEPATIIDEAARRDELDLLIQDLILPWFSQFATPRS